MIDLMTIQVFLRKINPKWSFLKIAFISYLMLQLLKRHMQAIDANYVVIKRTKDYAVWYDKTSQTYALEKDNAITPYDKKEDIAEYL